jgi:uncharacterized protein (TIGR04222 family)
MNPFTLHGFAFLLFYAVLAAGVLVSLYTVLRRLETADPQPLPPLTDPYLIACLRADANEAMRVATVALLDRNLLQAIGEDVKSKNRQTMEMVQRPLEKAILKKFQVAAGAHEIFKDSDAKKACAAYAKVLKSYGLIANAGLYLRRLTPMLIALAILIGVAGIKIQIALSEGHDNIGFLLILAVVACLFAAHRGLRRITTRGDNTVAGLQQLFLRLKQRSSALPKGGETNEMAMLAGVFGLSALSASDYPFLEKLYPTKSSDGSSCGSSSSCSSGSSCSGGCGGGGCGG